MHHKDQRKVGDHRHRLEALERVVAGLVDDRPDRHRAARADQNRVAVGRFLRRVVGRKPPARARLVLDDHGPAGASRCSFVRDEAREDVVAAAGREADDHADHLVRIVAAPCACAGAPAARERERSANQQCDAFSRSCCSSLMRANLAQSLRRTRRASSSQRSSIRPGGLFTASGRSSVERWPQSGTLTSLAPGIPAAISSERNGGVSSSCCADQHQCRAADRRQQRPRVGARQDRILLAHIGFAARHRCTSRHGFASARRRARGPDAPASATRPRSPRRSARFRRARYWRGASAAPPANHHARWCRAAPARSTRSAARRTISSAM